LVGCGFPESKEPLKPWGYEEDPIIGLVVGTPCGFLISSSPGLFSERLL